MGFLSAPHYIRSTYYNKYLITCIPVPRLNLRRIHTYAALRKLDFPQGFYNRPWTRGQRMDLFGKMKCYGLNAYLYAPKDDHKHRALWRDAYDGPERDELR